MFKAKGLGEKPWLTVVGVAPDLQMEGFNTVNNDGSGFYVPMAQETVFNQNITTRHMTFILRGTGDDPMNWLPRSAYRVAKI